MKFFTKEWWKADSPDYEAVYTKYHDYLASVHNQIPGDLLLFEKNYTLHDAEVKRISNDFQERSVTIIFNGWDQPLQKPLRYKMHFTEVTSFELIYPQQEDVVSELDDLAYWEIEALNSVIQVGMIFVTEAEFHIKFNGFTFVQEQRTII